MKHILCNYLNISLLFFKIFGERTESVFYPEIFHKTFSCKADEIFGIKAFQMIFLKYNIECFLLIVSYAERMRQSLCLFLSEFS